jgi:hypothetical protein
VSLRPPALIRLIRALALHVSRSCGAGGSRAAQGRRAGSVPGSPVDVVVHAALSGRNFNAMRRVSLLSMFDGRAGVAFAIKI